MDLDAARVSSVDAISISSAGLYDSTEGVIAGAAAADFERVGAGTGTS